MWTSFGLGFAWPLAVGAAQGAGAVPIVWLMPGLLLPLLAGVAAVWWWGGGPIKGVSAVDQIARVLFVSALMLAMEASFLAETRLMPCILIIAGMAACSGRAVWELARARKSSARGAAAEQTEAPEEAR